MFGNTGFKVFELLNDEKLSSIRKEIDDRGKENVMKIETKIILYLP